MSAIRFMNIIIGSTVILIWCLSYYLSTELSQTANIAGLTVNKYGNIPLDHRLSSYSPSLLIPIVTIFCLDKKFFKELNFDRKIFGSTQRQIEQMRVMLGTLLFFNPSYTWRIIVFTSNKKYFNEFLKELNQWPPHLRQKLMLEPRDIFVPDKKFKFLMDYYRPCAWQKIFLDTALHDLDAAIFIDNDVLFTGEINDIWDIFGKMNNKHAIALAPDTWYIKAKERHFAGKVGVNTGIMVMNLTRLRALPNGGLGQLLINESKHLTKPVDHDQDLMNEFLSTRGHLLYELSYRWNLMISYCSPYAPPCPECYEKGVSIVHGADASFYRNSNAKFKMLFHLMNEVTVKMDFSAEYVLQEIESRSDLLDSLFYSFPCSSFKEIIEYTTVQLKRIKKNH